MADIRNLLPFIRPPLVGAGGALLGLMLYLSFRRYFSGVPLYTLMALGLAVGSAVERSIVSPLVDYISFDGRLADLRRLLDEGKIDREVYQKILNQLVERRFLEQSGWPHLLVSSYRSFRSRLLMTPR